MQEILLLEMDDHGGGVGTFVSLSEVVLLLYLSCAFSSLSRSFFRFSLSRSFFCSCCMFSLYYGAEEPEKPEEDDLW